jgi:hypothetical protein
MRLALVLALFAAPLAAQTATVPAEPDPIMDNSFLIEEAYNQPVHVVQHISTFQRAQQGGGWMYSFTQEWPLLAQRHQVSLGVPLQRLADGVPGVTGVGDVAVNYRYQIAGVDGGALAAAPRLSLLLPTGDVNRGMGSGAAGAQVNLPVSLQLTPWLVTHWNAGATFVPGARNDAGAKAATTGYNLGQSFIWLARPTLNLMLETSWTSTESVLADDLTERSRALYVAPGVRYAINLKSGMQIVPGAAYVMGTGPSRGDRSVFTYLSIEHAF